MVEHYIVKLNKLTLKALLIMPPYTFHFFCFYVSQLRNSCQCLAYISDAYSHSKRKKMSIKRCHELEEDHDIQIIFH